MIGVGHCELDTQRNEWNVGDNLRGRGRCGEVVDDETNSDKREKLPIGLGPCLVTCLRLVYGPFIAYTASSSFAIMSRKYHTQLALHASTLMNISNIFSASSSVPVHTPRAPGNAVHSSKLVSEQQSSVSPGGDDEREYPSSDSYIVLASPLPVVFRAPPADVDTDLADRPFIAYG